MVHSQKLAGIALLVVAILLTIIGICGVGVYVWTVIDVANEPDRSLLFWYFPFLAFGIMLGGAGIVTFIKGNTMYRKSQVDATRSGTVTGAAQNAREE